MTTNGSPLLSADGLTKHFRVQEQRWRGSATRVVKAVNDVSLSIERGDVIGIVGESGSGKSTLARMLVRLIEPSSGSIRFKGRDILSLTHDQLRADIRPAVRMIFQDPDAVLNPAYTVGVGLVRALRLTRSITDDEVQPVIAKALNDVGIDPSFADKFPDELSGGEKRRIGICRALLTDPEIIVADEPLSGLDVVLQERVLGLFKYEQQRRGFALVLISHDLDRVNQVCDRVLVMYAGRVVEDMRLQRNGGDLEEQYRHPYSIMLQRARLDFTGGADGPQPHGDGNETLTPDSSAEERCPFSPQCARRLDLNDPSACTAIMPPLTSIAPGQSVACHFPDPPRTA